MLPLYATEIQAICPHTGELRIYRGPDVPGISLSTAQEYCDINELEYCKPTARIAGEWVEDADGNTFFVDWDKNAMN